MYVIPGTASKSVAEEISRKIGAPIATVTSKRFPDDELYIRITNDISGEDVVIVQTAYPDKNIIELLLLQNAAKESGAGKITTVIPYLGYSRQDKKFENGEPISIKAIAQAINLNTNRILTIDPHKDHILSFFSVPAISCSVVNEIANYLKIKNVDLVLAPDKGALERAKKTSKIIGCEFDYMEKTRIDGLTVNIKPKNLDVKNKNVAIIDDIISTGVTMAKSINELKRQGANKIFVSCTHGLFAGDAIKKLESSGCDEIISTDTIISEYSKVKIAACLIQYLQ